MEENQLRHLQIQPTVPPARCGHVAVSFDQYMLVWGGYAENAGNLSNTYFSGGEVWVYSCLTEKWYLKTCLSSDHPPGMSGSSAVVIRDALYIFGGFCYYGRGCTNKLYKLDLETFLWEKVEPKGIMPIAVDKMTAWEYNQKLYIFGGFRNPPPQDCQFEFNHMVYRGWTNQFFEYDPVTNQWTCPKYNGDLPRARAAHASAVLEDKVYIFGGRHDAHRLNDLHCLDMTTMCWSGEIHSNGPVPQGRSWHSLTAVGNRHLILYGGFSQLNNVLSDCWMYDTHARLWLLIELPYCKPRLWHCAARSIFNEVLIHGGCSTNILDLDRIPEQATDLITISIVPKALLRLCLDILVSMPQTRMYWNILPLRLQHLLQIKMGTEVSQSVIGS